MPVQSHLNKHWAAPCLLTLFLPVRKGEINYFTLPLIMFGCQNVFLAKHCNYVLCSSPLSLRRCWGERKQRCSEVFAVSVTLPHLSYQTVAMWFHSPAILRFVITSCLLNAWAWFLFLVLVVFICLSLFACAYLYTEACLMCARSKVRQCTVIRTFPPSWYSSIYFIPREKMLLLSLHANVNVQRHCMQYLSFWWAEVLCLESRLCGNADTANLFSILLLWWAPTRLVCHL